MWRQVRPVHGRTQGSLHKCLTLLIVSAFVVANLGFLNPVVGGQPSDSFGDARSGHLHAGTDIFAPAGTAIVSPVTGTVVSAGASGGLGGNRIWIQAKDGFFYYFAHLKDVLVSVGQSVTVGANIGTVGSTGNADASSPHLHFSVNGQVGSENPVIDPFDLIKGQVGDASFDANHDGSLSATERSIESQFLTAHPAQGSGMATLSWESLTDVQKRVVSVIVETARKYNVDARTALASGWVESSFNPTAIGDNNSSFGIFQLHRGGELGNLTPQQAFDPKTNAEVALKVFDATDNDTSLSPGWVAAKSQRPADQTGYAAKVNALYADPNWLSDVPLKPDGTVPWTGTSDLPVVDITNAAPISVHVPIPGTGGVDIPSPSDVVGSVAEGFWSGMQAAVDAMMPYIIRATLVIFGLVLITIALHSLSSTAATPLGAAVDGGKNAADNVKKHSANAAELG